MTTANRLGVNYMPFMIAVMMAASAGFATPIGYQTNLMVYGPGGYRFSDYLRIGVPLDILVGVITILWRRSSGHSDPRRFARGDIGVGDPPQRNIYATASPYADAAVLRDASATPSPMAPG